MKPTPNLPSRKPDAWLKRTACQGAVATLLVATAWPALADTQHRVVAGDTLWSIAEQHTGEGTQWPRLQQANRLDEKLCSINPFIRIIQFSSVVQTITINIIGQLSINQ